jgi:hypothetical protein
MGQIDSIFTPDAPLIMRELKLALRTIVVVATHANM